MNLIGLIRERGLWRTVGTLASRAGQSLGKTKSCQILQESAANQAQTYSAGMHVGPANLEMVKSVLATGED